MSHADLPKALLAPFAGEKILLQHRPKGMDEHGDRWGFFGGAIEDGETPEEALVREVQEELGLSLTKFEPFRTYDFNGRIRHVFTTTLEVRPEQLNQQEGDVMQFFSRDELQEISLSENDRQMLGDLFSR